MEVVSKQTADGRSRESEREELQSSLNRMMDAASSWKRERAQLVAACDQLRRQLTESESTAAAWERQCMQLTEARDRVQQELSTGETAATSWKQERDQLLAQHNQLRTQLLDSEEGAGIALERQVTAAIEKIRSELTAENGKLREELQRSIEGASQWEAERSRLLAELGHATQSLGDTEEAAAIALERQISTAIQRARTEWSAEEQKLREEVQRLQTERDQAAGSTQHTAEEVERVRREWTGERDRLRQDLDAAMQLCTRRASEYADLAVERDRLKQLLADAAEGQQKQTTDAVQREVGNAVANLRTEMEGEKEQLRNQLESDRIRLSKELDDARVYLTKAQSTATQATSDAREAERKASELLADRDRLRVQLEQAMEASAQKDLQLQHWKDEYELAVMMLEEAKAEKDSTEVGVTTELVSAEEGRIEDVIRELSLLIDDPGTELSTVIRKTVERAQLDYYLKGLRFSTTGESPSTH